MSSSDYYNYTYDLTPSDTVDLPKTSPHFGFFDALYVGSAGVVALVREDGQVTQFTCVSGQVLPVRGKRINATNTTATLLRGLNAI